MMSPIVAEHTSATRKRPMAGLNLTYKQLYTLYIINAVSDFSS